MPRTHNRPPPINRAPVHRFGESPAPRRRITSRFGRPGVLGGEPLEGGVVPPLSVVTGRVEDVLATTSTTAAHGCCGGQQFERREAGFEGRRRGAKVAGRLRRDRCCF